MIAAAAICIWLGYALGNARLGYVEDERIRLTERTQRLQTLNEQLEYQINILRVERDVDRVAIEKLQQELRQSHVDAAETRRELAFFQQIMAPELDADGVVIDSLTLTTAGEGIYHFRLILLQLERTQQNMVTGTYSLTIRGRSEAEQASYDLLQLAGIEQENGERSFSMNYFNRLDGTFQLPDNFQPEMIAVEIQVRGERQFSQQFPWAELVERPGPALQLNQDID